MADLGNDSKPGVDGDMQEALVQRSFHVGRAAVVEPEREQAQDVLQMRPLPPLRCSPSAQPISQGADYCRKKLDMEGSIKKCCLMLPLRQKGFSYALAQISFF